MTRSKSPRAVSESAILRPPETCWRVEPASRAAFLVDAARYFEVLEAALRRARHQVLILGWDVHSRTRLGPRTDDESGIELADLLREITENRPELRVNILGWDFAPIYMAEREFLPLVQLGIRAGPGVTMRLDAAHPIGASHHQKVVVIDDRVAFFGGIDLTIHRWDAPTHDPDDDRRVLPGGETYAPYHDVQMMVEGDAARALGALARERWHMATRARLEPPEADGDPWPDGVRADLEDAKVGIARTMPAYRGREEAREIEALYLSAVSAARRSIYIENQYLTGRSVGDALCECLRAPNGPEVTIVVPRVESGPLEQAVLGALRTQIVEELRRADEHGRLRIVTPTSEGEDVYVHAKVLIVDDALALVGSANICNRSMGLDTECDLAIEADDAASRRAIASLRAGLLGEHLGVGVARIEEELDGDRSVSDIIDDLSSETRALSDLEVDADASGVLEPDIADPPSPIIESYVRRNLPKSSVETAERSLPRRIAAGAVALVALASVLAWVHFGTPAPSTLVAQLEVARDHPAGSAIVLGAFVVASLVMVPVNVLIIAAVALLGPWMGAAVSWASIGLSAVIGWGTGRLAWRDLVRRLAGDRLNDVSRRLARHGLAAVVAVRVIPIAPFTVVSLVAGSSRVSLADFVLGTLIGTLPGVLLLGFASDRILSAVQDPSASTVIVAILALLSLGLAVWVLRRVLRGSS